MELTIDGVTKSCCGGRSGWKRRHLEKLSPNKHLSKLELCKELVLASLKVPQLEKRKTPPSPRRRGSSSLLPFEELETLAFLHGYEVYGLSKLGKVTKDLSKRFCLLKSDNISGTPPGIVFIDKYKRVVEVYGTKELEVMAKKFLKPLEFPYVVKEVEERNLTFRFEVKLLNPNIGVEFFPEAPKQYSSQRGEVLATAKVLRSKLRIVSVKVILSFL